MESPVQCGCNAHAAPGFFLWQELPLKHPKRMRSPMPQKGIGEFPQQAENRFRVNEALLQRVDILKSRMTLPYLDYQHC